MIGAIIGAVGSLAATAIGSAQTARANREAKNAALGALDKAQTRNENLYNYRMGAPRYAAQTLLNQTADVLRDRKAARQGARNVVGGTQASVQAGNQQDLSMLNNATQTAVAQGLEDRKEAVKEFTEQSNALDMKRAEVESSYNLEQAKNTAAATQGVVSAMGSVASAISSRTKSNSPKSNSPKSDSPKSSNTSNGGNAVVTTPASMPSNTKTVSTVSSNGGMFKQEIENPFAKNPFAKSSFNETLDKYRRSKL